MPIRDSAKTLSKCLRVGLALAALVAVVLCALTSTPAEAKSSGGYSRPSFSSSSRSSSSGSYHSGGSSSYSGGSSYVRPPMSALRTVFPSSAGDRTISRQSAEQALKRFREDRPSAPSYEPPRRPSLTPSREEAPIGYARRPSLEPGYRPPPSSSSWGWSPPPNVSPSASSYNGWNPFLFWFLLDRLADPGNARFFHNTNTTRAMRNGGLRPTDAHEATPICARSSTTSMPSSPRSNPIRAIRTICPAA